MHSRDPLAARRAPEDEARRRPAAPAEAADGPTIESRVLGLQATAGNAAVTSLLHPGQGGAGLGVGVSIQRLWDDEAETDADDDGGGDTDTDTDGGVPDEGGAPDTSGGGDDGGTAASADTAQLDQAASDVAAQLDPPKVMDELSTLASPGSEPGDYPLPADGDTAQAMFIQRDPPDGSGPTTRPGGPGDVVKALMPFVRPALDKLLADVLATIRKLQAGEKVAATIVIAPIVLAPLTQPGPRRLALDQLDGTDVTFGVIPNLQLKPSISDGQLKGATLTYDLAPALRKLGVPF